MKKALTILIPVVSLLAITFGITLIAYFHVEIGNFFSNIYYSLGDFWQLFLKILGGLLMALLPISIIAFMLWLRMEWEAR